jgi:hypothetical protein
MTNPARHHLKCLPVYFDAAIHGLKSFEIRCNDRQYRTGDYVYLEEFDVSTGMYTGRQTVGYITFITDYMQHDGYVVLGIEYGDGTHDA